MNNRATYNDFLYAITVGNAIAMLDNFTFGPKLLGALLLFAIVLEDFYTYKTIVATEDPDGRHYKLKSLYTELAILISWWAAFIYWMKEGQISSVVALSVFWAIKGYAGLSYYMKASRYNLQKVLIECIHFLPALMLSIAMVVGKLENSAFQPWVCFTWNIVCWIIVYGGFRWLRSLLPKEQAA